MLANAFFQVMLVVMLGLGRFCLKAGGGAHQWNITLKQSNDVVFVRNIHAQMSGYQGGLTR